LQQWQDAGIETILKMQHRFHQACLSCGALCGKEKGKVHWGVRTWSSWAALQLMSKPRLPSTPWEDKIKTAAPYNWWERKLAAGYQALGNGC
jgi:hypothetical protein